MNISEIIKEGISYPVQNIKALLVYIILGFLIGVITVFTGISGFVTGSINFGAGVALGIVGIVIVICIYLLMLGFSLDIIKLGIEKSPEAPGIDMGRQITNGVKYIVVSIVYLIIPILIVVVLGFIFKYWIAVVLGVILAIIFAFALVIAEGRLAKYESLSEALKVGEVISDLQSIGVGKVVGTIILSEIVGLIIMFVILFIINFLLGLLPMPSIVATISSIITIILSAWFLFYNNRVIGLLYSELEEKE